MIHGKWLYGITGALSLATAAPAWAHPGHGPLEEPVHTLLSWDHGGVIVLLLIVAGLGALYLRGKIRASRGGRLERLGRPE